MENWFVFNNISSKELGVYLLEPPTRTIPKIRANTIENDFMDGTKVEMRGVSSFDITLKIGFHSKKANEEAIYQWLLTGQTGKLSFSDDLERYYEVYLLDQIEFTQKGRFYKTATIKFLAQPFKKYVNESMIDIGAKGSFYVVNTGNYFCEPKIQMTGTGIFHWYINGVKICTIDFGGTERTLVMDSQAKECTLEDGTLANRSMIGGFITFPVGTNNIELRVPTDSTYHIGSINIWMNTRWL